MNTIVDVVPRNARSGQRVTVREILILVGGELMRGDGRRVVSAWRQIPTMGSFKPSGPGSTYDEFCKELRVRVCRDIGHARGMGSDLDAYLSCPGGLGAYWCYGPYVELCRDFGDEWPVETLAAYLRVFDGRELMAQSVWEQAVYRYETFKDSFLT